MPRASCWYWTHSTYICTLRKCSGDWATVTMYGMFFVIDVTYYHSVCYFLVTIKILHDDNDDDAIWFSSTELMYHVAESMRLMLLLVTKAQAIEMLPYRITNWIDRDDDDDNGSKRNRGGGQPPSFIISTSGSQWGWLHYLHSVSRIHQVLFLVVLSLRAGRSQHQLPVFQLLKLSFIFLFCLFAASLYYYYHHYICVVVVVVVFVVVFSIS